MDVGGSLLVLFKHISVKKKYLTPFLFSCILCQVIMLDRFGEL